MTIDESAASVKVLPLLRSNLFLHLTTLPAGREVGSGTGAPTYVHHRPERTLLNRFVEEYYPAIGITSFLVGLYASMTQIYNFS